MLVERVANLSTLTKDHKVIEVGKAVNPSTLAKDRKAIEVARDRKAMSAVKAHTPGAREASMMMKVRLKKDHSATKEAEVNTAEKKAATTVAKKKAEALAKDEKMIICKVLFCAQQTALHRHLVVIVVVDDFLDLSTHPRETTSR